MIMEQRFSGEVRVELYAEGDTPVRVEMIRGERLRDAEVGYSFSATVPATRPSGDYTARVIPYKDGAAVPLEAVQILWQH